MKNKKKMECIKVILQDIHEEKEKLNIEAFLQSVSKIKRVSDIVYNPEGLAFYIYFDIGKGRITDKDIKNIVDSYQKLVNSYDQGILYTNEFQYEISFGDKFYYSDSKISVYAVMIIEIDPVVRLKEIDRLNGE